MTGLGARGVIDRVIETARHCEVVALRGNHEVMMLASRANATNAHNWCSFGGSEALESYGTDFTRDWVAAVPDAHWRFLEGTQTYLESETHIFVHGAVDGRRTMTEQDPYRLLWGRCFDITPHVSGKPVICGHTPQEDGEIGCYPWGFCIDTGCCRGGWVTCLEIETGRYWQANEEGRVREQGGATI